MKWLRLLLARLKRPRPAPRVMSDTVYTTVEIVNGQPMLIYSTTGLTEHGT